MAMVHGPDAALEHLRSAAELARGSGGESGDS
jgi:hypothetical protein